MNSEESTLSQPEPKEARKVSKDFRALQEAADLLEPTWGFRTVIIKMRRGGEEGEEMEGWDKLEGCGGYEELVYIQVVPEQYSGDKRGAIIATPGGKFISAQMGGHKMEKVGEDETLEEAMRHFKGKRRY